MDFTGTSGDDTLTGTSGDDLFKVFQGGNDTVSGLTGSDVFNFAGTLTAADTIDGGGGQDTVQIKGDYAAGILFSATTMVNVETLTVGAGFNYTITTDDATVAAGAVFTLNAAALAAPNYVVFNGSNETDGLLHFHGGAGDDTVGMGPNMSADDHFDGGDGNDELLLGGVNTLTFKSVTIHNIEKIALVPTFGGSLAFNSGNVLAGQTIEIDGSSVSGAGSYTINAHNLPGNVIFDGGEHDVKVTGGSGNDIFNMGAVFTRNDRLDGGTGNDTLNLNGDYNLTFASGTIANIDEMTLAGGHSYHLTSADNLVTDQTMAVNATGLTASDTLFLDFSSETLGSVILDGGAAPAILKGGQQGDAFDFSVTSQGGFTASDQIDGQGGYDRLYLDGDYTGAHALAFTNTTMVNVEEIDFNAGHSYSLTLSGKNVAVGGSLVADASQLGASDTLTFNGAASSSTATLHILGGAGDDVLTGGRGNNSFDLTHGGNDTATGQAGTDVFTMGATLNAADKIDGGAGNDTILLAGTTNVTMTGTTIANIETITMAAGSNYTLAIANGNVALEQTLTIDAGALGAGNTLNLNTTADVTGGFYDVIAGAGNDTIVMGQAFGNTIDLTHGGNDTVNAMSYNTLLFGSTFTSADRVNGNGEGQITIDLDGDYTGANALSLNNTDINGIAKIALAGGHSYNFTYTSATSITQGTFLLDGSALGAADTLTADMSAMKTAVGSFGIAGGAGDDHILGPKNGGIDLSAGGNDFADAKGGTVAMGAAFNSGDVLRNVSELELGGNYDTAHGTALNLTTDNLTGGGIALLGPGFSYEITVSSADVLSGFEANFPLTVTFDGSAETTKAFTFQTEGHDTIFGGGGGDTVTGFNTTLVFHGNGGDDSLDLTTGTPANDKIDGGAGNDTVRWEEVANTTLTADSLVSVETLELHGSALTNHITTADGNVAAGATLTVDILASSTALDFNGAAETDGSFDLIDTRQGGNTLVGGAQGDAMNVIGNNTLTGGGGGDRINLGAPAHADTLNYAAVTDSTSTGYDTLTQLNFGTDHLHVSGIGLPSAIDAAVTTGALSVSGFDTKLAAAIGAGQLAAHHAVLFTADSGTLSGHTFLVVDENGTAGYQTGADLVIDVTGAGGTLTTTSFS